MNNFGNAVSKEYVDEVNELKKQKWYQKYWKFHLKAVGWAPYHGKGVNEDYEEFINHTEVASDSHSSKICYPKSTRTHDYEKLHKELESSRQSNEEDRKVEFDYIQTNGQPIYTSKKVKPKQLKDDIIEFLDLLMIEEVDGILKNKDDETHTEVKVKRVPCITCNDTGYVEEIIPWGEDNERTEKRRVRCLKCDFHKKVETKDTEEAW